MRVNLKISYIVLVVTFLCFSCSTLIVPRDIKKSFYRTYGKDDMDITFFIKINGYYQFSKPVKRNMKETQDSVFWYCIFYKDGMCIYSLDKFFVSNWGYYWIENDTIKVRFAESPGGQSWAYGEAWFKINDKVLEQVCINFGGSIDNKYIKDYEQQFKGEKYKAIFFPTQELPNPDKSWIKNKRWFWYNEADYDEWKKRDKD